jgi:hypothetical protein
MNQITPHIVKGTKQVPQFLFYSGLVQYWLIVNRQLVWKSNELTEEGEGSPTYPPLGRPDTRRKL